MQLHFGNLIGPQGRECPQPNMQGQMRDTRAGVPAGFQDLRREVQPRRGSGHRSALGGVHGLVAVAIRRRVGALDIGRQRHMPHALDLVPQRALAGEANRALTKLIAAQHVGLQPLAEDQLLAGANLAARMHEAQPRHLVPGQGANEQRLHLACEAVAMPQQARREDACVVECQHVAGPQVAGQVGKHLVLQLARGAVDQQHARGAAIRQRLLRDQLFRQCEVEVRDPHLPAGIPPAVQLRLQPRHHGGVRPGGLELFTGILANLKQLRLALGPGNVF